MARISKLEVTESLEELRCLAKGQALAKNRDRIQALIHLKENQCSFLKNGISIYVTS